MITRCFRQGFQPAAGIELVRRHRGAANQLDAMIVEHIDQQHEAARDIVVLPGHLPDIGQDQRIEETRQLEVIVLAAAGFAEFVKIEPDRVLGAIAVLQ